ncbi:uncharacterized protein LOC130966374 [Arachis stenosperma]|uniref:uncharacterized protein LOC130966374 n=1 Tax=Arachis stenosperma TaxID=217475 RepID=UPI0025AB7009|nr:uncharacterized protein LOC130966374 [Arachis stenosperma]
MHCTGKRETLYEYWEQFRKLLDSCPNRIIDTQVLLSYICQGMREQDKNLLDASSNGSLSKYRMAEETWQLITDLAESTQHARQRINRPKAINEVSTSSETAALVKYLGEMTNILKQLQLGQQQPQPPPPPQQHSQQLEEIEIEEVNKEEDAQVVVEDEVSQPTNEVYKDEKALEEEISQPIPFLTLARKARKRVGLDPKMVEMFKKVEVTISLFDVIHQVPKYAKFLKDLCLNKDRIHELETIPLGSSISALMGALPEKCDDPGPCMVTYTIDRVQFLDCLVFPIDFYVLEMPSSESERTSSILLGRPFSRTSRFKLDAYSGTYSFEIDGRVVSFSLEEAMKHPPENHSIFRCNLIDNIVAEVHYAMLDEKHMIEEISDDPSEMNTLPHPNPPEVQVSSQD